MSSSAYKTTFDNFADIQSDYISVPDFYTMLFRGDIETGSSIIKLSSTVGVYRGRILYTSDMEDYFTIISVNHETNTVTIDGCFDYNEKNVILTLE
jgi:hypothetical protein